MRTLLLASPLLWWGHAVISYMLADIVGTRLTLRWVPALLVPPVGLLLVIRDGHRRRRFHALAHRHRDC